MDHARVAAVSDASTTGKPDVTGTGGTEEANASTGKNTRINILDLLDSLPSSGSRNSRSCADLDGHGVCGNDAEIGCSGNEKAPAVTLFTQNCKVSVCPDRPSQYEFDLWLEVASKVREQCLDASPRIHSTSKDLSSVVRLPSIHCCMCGCGWKHDGCNIVVDHLETKEDHPWDALLRSHVETEHCVDISNIVATIFSETPADLRVWDVYKQAIAVRERETFPEVGLAVDRRCFDYTCALVLFLTIRK